jgi:hypothetical protein
MRIVHKLAAAIVACSLLAACGSEDFTGAYRFKNSNSDKAMVLNIHGGEAELFAEDGHDGRIKPLIQLKVSSKGEKLLLDNLSGTERLALKRNVDERSLDCLNCKVLGMKEDAAVWKYDPKGPFDVAQLLKDQARKDEDALNAEMKKTQDRLLEQAKRDEQAAKLAPYEGDWVNQRVTKQDPLSIMTIWRKTQIKAWSFNFENMNRLGQGVPNFEITDAGLKIGDSPNAHLYTLSPDKQTLTCVDCVKPQRWAKADPKKDLSDRRYAREMAGNP